jgi:hypothetical protein
MAFYMTIENSVKDAITRDLNTKPWFSSKMRNSLWKNINKKLNHSVCQIIPYQLSRLVF